MVHKFGGAYSSRTSPLKRFKTTATEWWFTIRSKNERITVLAMTTCYIFVVSAELETYRNDKVFIVWIVSIECVSETTRGRLCTSTHTHFLGHCRVHWICDTWRKRRSILMNVCRKSRNKMSFKRRATSPARYALFLLYALLRLNLL